MGRDINIHLDYGALSGDDPLRVEIDIELVKKAKGYLGQRSRQKILDMLDPILRVEATKVAKREVGPKHLYVIGRAAVQEAIDSYQIGQKESFREFAVAYCREAMTIAKSKGL